MNDFWAQVLVVVVGGLLLSFLLWALKALPKLLNKSVQYLPEKITIKEITGITAVVLTFMTGPILVFILLKIGSLTIAIYQEYSHQVSTEEDVAKLEIQKMPIYGLFHPEWRAIIPCIKLVNKSNFKATNLRIKYQYFIVPLLWSRPFSSIKWCERIHFLDEPPDDGRTIQILHPTEETELRLIAEAFSTQRIEELLAEGKKLYFSIRFEWNNPNDTISCLVQYIEIYADSSKTDSYHIQLLSKLPQDIPAPQYANCPR